MNAANHTPGPWRHVRNAKGELFILAFGGQTELPETEANARLIAAAPDLLAALQTVIESADDTGCSSDLTVVESAAVDQARTAIAKATGGAS